MVMLKSKNTETIIEEKGYKRKLQPKANAQEYGYSNKNIRRPKQKNKRNKFKEGKDTEYEEREEMCESQNRALKKAGVKI